MASLEFFDDPAAFLDVAGDVLAADPVRSTVVAGVSRRMRDEEEPPLPGVPLWWVVAREGGDVAGVGMRTARSAPHPPYLLPMPDAAAVELARVLHERGERVDAVNGALPAARLFADETARLTGGEARVAIHMRLFELGELVPVSGVPGRMRAATPEDADLLADWFEAFMTDADEQAGRPPGAGFHESISREDLLRRVEAQCYWLWLDTDDQPVHVTAVSPPSFGVSRVGPVYTPAERRGHGYASAAVAAVSEKAVAAGARVCLFTDQANPTSNAIYQRIGYRPVVDMVNLAIAR